MNKYKLTWIIVLALLVVGVTAVMAASVEPTVIPDASNTDKTCAVVMPGTFELKYDFDEAEWSDTGDGSLLANFEKPSTLAGSLNSIDWTSNNAVLGVIVKDGVDGANWYDYSSDGSTGDTYLTTPFDGAKGISHISFCYVPSEDYEELTVSKTADTSYNRLHKWKVDKFVNPDELYLYIDGSGDDTVEWIVDVTYRGYLDKDFNVFGQITIENTGTLDAVITSVDDLLAGMPISVDCGVAFPYTFPAGAEPLVCSYNEDVDGKLEGVNEVTVTTEVDTYDAEPAELLWGDPVNDINANVTVSDKSDLFGQVVLGTLDAYDYARGEVAQFTYSKNFAWADYGKDNCGDHPYHNLVKIIGDDDKILGSDGATLIVHVQCYIYETAYAKGDDANCFIPTFANWGWTNPIGPGTYEWDLWAAAGQCDTGKGTLVGSVTVVYGADGYVTVTYNVGAPYLLDETHVYAGTTPFPQVKRGKSVVYTIAPGQYTNNSPFNGSPVYVIAHAVVGIPDPNFGP